MSKMDKVKMKAEKDELEVNSYVRKQPQGEEIVVEAVVFDGTNFNAVYNLANAQEYEVTDHENSYNVLKLFFETRRTIELHEYCWLIRSGPGDDGLQTMLYTQFRREYMALEQPSEVTAEGAD